MKVEQGKKIKMEYELGVEGGETIESSESRGPIEFICGSGAMLAGLEKAIEGMEAEQEREGVIPAEEAFGTLESLPTKDLTREDFPEGEEVEVGKVFEAKDPAGNVVKFTVVEMEGDKIVVRFDHPLAGKDIRYKVKILEISDPN
jgi:peptidylprolyl isomerase